MSGKEFVRGLLNKGRRVAAVFLAGSILVGGTVFVKAASLKDVFDTKQYAEDYADLMAAFGYDEDALLNHYLTYGIEEERELSGGLLDVVRYRAAYPDLDAAFGDDWDAYVDHYLTYGIYEGRDNFTDFDAQAYVERYADLKEAFGDDALALFQHYLTYGREEGRDAHESAANNASVSTGGQNSSGGGTNVRPSEGNTSGNTGGNADDNTGGNTDGNADDNTGGNTGGNADENTGGNTGGNVDDNIGGNTGGNTEGNTGGNTGSGDEGYDWTYIPEGTETRTEQHADGGWSVYAYEWVWLNDTLEDYDPSKYDWVLRLDYSADGNFLGGVRRWYGWQMVGEGGEWEHELSVHELDSAGNYITFTWYSYNSDNTLKRYGYKDYASARRIEKKYDDYGNLIHLSEYEFDSAGNNIWEKWVDYDEDMGATFVAYTTYDSAGEIVSYDYYWETGNTVPQHE